MLSTYQKQKEIDKFRSQLEYINTKAGFDSVEDRKESLEYRIDILEERLDALEETVEGSREPIRTEDLCSECGQPKPKEKE